MTWESNPSGLCKCGCGQPTTRAPRGHAPRNIKRGEPLDWIQGHVGSCALEDKYKVDETTGCWVWQKALNSCGYGSVTIGKGRVGGAHRLIWERVHGPVPEGLELDHLCRNRACVNPDHLEPVTHAENVRRGVGLAADKARQTHCKHGHVFDEANTYFRADNGCRQCRTCRNEGVRRIAERKRAA